jgi:hypothetical protein
MESLQVHLFKDSFGPFLTLLNENEVPYKMHSQRSLEPMACAEILEILKSDGLWGGLAAVIVAFLKYRTSRKIIITTNDNQIIHAENISKNELEKILKTAKSITAIETKKD